MVLLVLILIVPSLLIAWIACGVARTLSLRAGAVDTAPMPGQVKAPSRGIPNTGGIGIASAVFMPMIAGLIAINFMTAEQLPSWATPVGEHLEGLRAVQPMGWAMVVGGLWLHALGLIDDRRPLGPVLKLAAMVLPALVLAAFFDVRLLTLIDRYPAGRWLSIAITILWFLVVTNAMNFIDNMDGLCAGVTAVAGSMFLAAVLLGGQWFVAAILALLVGAALGFLIWNRPPAKLFMGDSGSLVIGYLLAFATIRTTYIQAETISPWYAVFMPLVVLAVPLYDLVSVTLIRLSQGKSPMVGDLQHFSHRLVERGLSKRTTVSLIVALSGITGVSGLLLTRTNTNWQAIAIGGQVALMLAIIGLFENRSIAKAGDKHTNG
ncbi:MAG: MraY family glycosyltransferase [Phycisphaerales bacterium]